MFDLRYHIASLVAVFLALGLGILIGFVAVGDDALVKEQKYLIDGLENEFHSLREKNTLAYQEMAIYREELDFWQGFSQVTFPYAIQGRLAGRRLAIVQTGHQNLPADLLGNLEIAGAEIVSVIHNDYLATLAQVLPAWAIEAEDMYTMEELANQMLEVAYQICDVIGVVTDDFEDENADLDVNYQFLDGVILVGGTDSQDNFFVEQLDLPLIKLLQRQGFLVAGVEGSEMPYSYIPSYRREADIIVEQIDTIPGQVALIWALTGLPGYYGVGTEVQGLLPDLAL